MRIYRSILAFQFIIYALLFWGCSKVDRALEVYNSEPPVKEGEVQVVIEPEYDHYYFGENIWLKVTIRNNTDEDFYSTALPDVLSVPLLVINSDGERIYSREIDDIAGNSRDSTKVPPHAELNSLINLNESYFPQRYVKKGVYTISGEYEKYPSRSFFNAIPRKPKTITINYPPAIKTNTIKIGILPTKEEENEVYNALFWNVRKDFKSEQEMLEFLVKEYPNSKFYPQIYNHYIYYLENDSAKFFDNIDHFFGNINSYENILLISRLEIYLKLKLNWNYEKRRNYITSLKNKYDGKKLKECVDIELVRMERYR